uniref:Uncharacterized protein n=1 Tax=Globodera pallida TaxID=36090 RepID=A0A183C1V4_GLOPA
MRFTIDLEANKNFDCNTLKLYTKLNVLSDCGKKHEKKNERIRVNARPNSDTETDGKESKHDEPRHKQKTVWKKCDDLKRRRSDDQYVGCLWDQLHDRLNEISEDYGLNTLIDDIGKIKMGRVGSGGGQLGMASSVD